jgi:hypothetical protein
LLKTGRGPEIRPVLFSVEISRGMMQKLADNAQIRRISTKNSKVHLHRKCANVTSRTVRFCEKSVEIGNGRISIYI